VKKGWYNMATELKQAEKMALIRAEILETAVMLPANAVQIDTAEWLIPTANGTGKITVSAVKGEVDLEEAAAEYAFALAEKATAKAKREAEAEAKKQANLAKKAKNAKPTA
jgi:hypothetical protein